MTSRGDPGTWKYKLALIIAAARYALGAGAGALSPGQPCPLTPCISLRLSTFLPVPPAHFIFSL